MPDRTNNRAEYITWNDGDNLNKAAAQISDNVESYGVVVANRRNFKDIDTNVSARPGFNRSDYDYFRPSEAFPLSAKESIAKSIDAYNSVGVVKKVIDLMSEFTCQGIKLVHPNKTIERFYQDWFKIVKGTERSERFANYLYKAGNVIVYRGTATLKDRKLKVVERVNASVQDIIRLGVQLEPGQIPWKYTFLNPLGVDVVFPEAINFIDKPQLVLMILPEFARKVVSPKNDSEKALLEFIPSQIINAIKKSERTFLLDQNKTSVYYYKKDDWQPWAFPLIHPILKDIVLYEKLKLTDLAACDGAISNIRLWRLGSLEHNILPNKSIINKLSDILNNNVGGGVVDLVWGPELDFKESNSDVYKFLGMQKYEPTLNAIYAGLGIPPSLTGNANSAGFTNNVVSLRTFIEQLNYGRNILTGFWDQEIALVQKTMGFRLPAKVIYGRPVITDEAAEKALLIQLADRDIISLDSVLERFDEFPEFEKQRLRRENKERKKGKLPPRASPFHQPQHKQNLEKIFAQKGAVTPSELGLDLQQRKDGENPAIEMQSKVMLKNQPKRKSKPVGVQGQGRPINSKDSTKRKQKTVKPLSIGMTQIWAENALGQINELLLPNVLELHQKSNLRQLTDVQANDFEQLKFQVLCRFKPYEKVNSESLAEILSTLNATNVDMSYQLNQLIDDFSVNFNRTPNLSEIRRLQTMAYCNQYTKTGDENVTS
jgi:hypothetical protein